MLKLSIVVPVSAKVKEERLRQVLDSLVQEVPSDEAEVIFVHGRNRLSTDLPLGRGFRIFQVDFSEALHDLRGAGIASSKGEIVTLLDGYTRPTEGWYGNLIRLHRELPYAAVGGAVEASPATRANKQFWWVYLAEYAAFMRPFSAGPRKDLAGNHVSYKRQALGSVERFLRNGFWKTFFNWELANQGHILWCTPELVVEVDKPIPSWGYVKDRFDHGRCFAGCRAKNFSWRGRAFRGLLAPVIPWLLLFRQLRELRLRVGFPIGLVPFLFARNLCWACGEAIGYLVGAGRSCSKVQY